MPDGDVVYYGVGRGQATAYYALCEGHFSDEEIAKKIGKSLRGSLKRYGNISLSLVMDTFYDVSSAISGGNTISSRDECLLIDDKAHELAKKHHLNQSDTQVHRRGIQLAMDSSKAYVRKICQVDSTIISESTIIREYVMRILDADFFEHLPLLNHHNNLDPEVIEMRLVKIQPYIAQEVERIVSSLIKRPDVNLLRKERRNPSAPSPAFDEMDVSRFGGAKDSDEQED